MLNRLVIHDVVLIEKMSLALEAGLNVFTGETGAGKSILLDALGLALGERSDASLVRQGSPQASITAEFSLKEDHALFELARERGLSAENPIIMRRIIGKDGKSRAFFNDQSIGIGLLKEFGETLLEIHGQFETHGLLNAATHRSLLDALGAFQKLKQQTKEAYWLWSELSQKLQIAEQTKGRAQAEEDFLRASVQELSDLDPKAGEADRLAAERTQLQHHEKIVEALTTASEILDGERGVCALLSQAGKAIARVSDKATGLPDLLASIDRTTNESAELSQQLTSFLFTLEAKPNALEAIEQRLFALRAAARKHSTQVDALPSLLNDLSSRLALISDGDTQLTKLAEDVAKARFAYVKLANELTLKRKLAAEKLEKEMALELPPLKLERARFIIDISSLEEEQWSQDGMDRIIFLASTNAGTPPGPLQKIASGGELARFMLALKTVLATADPVPVIVFDEVDTGIGGATATAVGERLAHLAQTMQILVVTHSPQVAARGNHHLKVSKRTLSGKTITEIETLDSHGRREEIARMLAGTEVTDAARQAADSLLGEDKAPLKRRVGKK